MRVWLATLLFITAPIFAAPMVAQEELKLLSEHAVDDMVGGNLSGLASCNGVLWTVSDRDDDVLYRLDTTNTVWKAVALHLDIPPVPDSGLSLALRSAAQASSLLRGGTMDFEGVSCDGQGNRYLVSEAFATVLKVPVEGAVQWLDLPKALVEQAQAQGMLQYFNAIFEGIAINAAGDRLWLAAERENRGLLAVQHDADGWHCNGSCVLNTDADQIRQPKQLGSKQIYQDYSDLMLYHDKLFTLERATYRICRRALETGAVERCWSFADEALQPMRLYDQPYGLTEALVVDDSGAWIGIDNNFGARADGEKRPIVWRFAAPSDGWDAR